MTNFLLPLAVACLSAFSLVIADSNNQLQCHTCLGRDWDNCERGTVTCWNGTSNGVCFKVVDKVRYITAKGCDFSRSVSDGESLDNIVVKDVKLYWEKDGQDLIGTGYYCNTVNPSKFCNAASFAQISTGLLMVMVTLMAVLMGWQ